MSWAGFKKNVNRATTQVMMKTGELVEFYPAMNRKRAIAHDPGLAIRHAPRFTCRAMWMRISE
ncbi:hypothetical protein PCG10_002578 [Penicillium crustosum]|uniref:Uncharacterized protein n=1 Tax=Penicillium crustosum TaxID=36656 RepID=A0A9P5GVN9_PENCR|nr:hypothetical protein PCG10_002578 [Penicillium crustosum]